jgi:hypothetical protein
MAIGEHDRQVCFQLMPTPYSISPEGIERVDAVS